MIDPSQAAVEDATCTIRIVMILNSFSVVTLGVKLRVLRLDPMTNDRFMSQ